MQVRDFDRILGGICAPEGFLASGVWCGIKDMGQRDLAIVYSEVDAVAAGVFTSNEVKAAPVLVSKEHLESKTARSIVINSGNANAMTGERGMKDARSVAETAEKTLNLSPGDALVASTGPIGEYLPIKKIITGIEQAAAELSPGGNTDAAKAIMTTDTYPKELAVEMDIGGKVVRIGAMAKGSGMIHPNLSTMICVITTDMRLDSDTMQQWLSQAVEWSFNRISVDGDQSTNDTVFMLANGAAFPDDYTPNKDEAELFFRALCWLTGNLAMALVKDGEGASKFISVVVNGAKTDDDAVRVARAIANSNLVKCSFFGVVPNWGRIAAALGTAGVPVEVGRLSISIGEHEVARKGETAVFSAEDIAQTMERSEIEITVDLGIGDGSAYFMTSDLSTEYVRINSSEKT